MIEFPEVVGYAVGGDVKEKYFVVQMHYDNPREHESRLLLSQNIA